MPLDECMKTHTQRQFRTWISWLDEQWDQPTLSDYYCMQIAAEVRRVLSNKPNSIKLEDFKMKFSKPKLVSKATSAKDKAAASLANWKAFLGVKSEDAGE